LIVASFQLTLMIFIAAGDMFTCRRELLVAMRKHFIMNIFRFAIQLPVFTLTTPHMRHLH